MLSKIVSTIEDSANTASMNFLSRQKCPECLPLPFTCQTTSKTRHSFVNGTCGKFSDIFSSETYNSETVLGFGRRFQIPLCVASRTRYLHGIQIWRVIRWPFVIFNHVQTALIEALLRDMCNVWRPMHLAESAAPSGISQLYSSMNFGSRN